MQRCPECGGPVVQSATGRRRRFCGEACSRVWYREDKRWAREIASIRLELADLESVLSMRMPYYPQLWDREQYRRDLAHRRLRAQGLRVELDSAIEKRRAHGWTGG